MTMIGLKCSSNTTLLSMSKTDAYVEITYRNSITAWQICQMCAIDRLPTLSNYKFIDFFFFC